MAAPQGRQQYTPQMNMAARKFLISRAIDCWQAVYGPVSFITGVGSQINIPLRNVGLNKRLFIQVKAQISGVAGTVASITPFGGANFFSNVTMTDLSNQLRINTTSWHLTFVASAKRKQPFGYAITASDTPFGYGDNYPQTQSAPGQLTAVAAANNVFLYYEVPISYSDDDLRGAIYSNVVNATYYLNLTVNPNLFATNAQDGTFAMYKTNSAAAANNPTLNSFSITIYQNYLDQIPIGPNGGPILPLFDLGTAYLLNNTVFSGVVQNSEYPLPYANFRDFLSTVIIFDNVGGTNLNPGTDIAYFTLQSANYTNIFKTADAYLPGIWNRNIMQEDMPLGTYYFDSRRKPISTVQYGNMQMIVNASTVNGPSAFFGVGYESLAIINQITNAGSLPGN